MKRLLFLIVVLFSVTLTYSTPTWIYMSTSSIEDYSGSGGNINLNDAHEYADQFWQGASRFVVPIMGSSCRRYQTLKDGAVTLASTRNSTAREYNDFIFLSGHGDTQLMTLVHDNNTWTLLTPSDGNYGTGYARWVYFYSCNVLEYSSNVYNNMDPAFSGIQCFIGFASVTFMAPQGALLMSTWWDQWVRKNRSLLQSHYDIANVMYQQGIPTRPAVMTATLPSRGTLPCFKTFEQSTSERANTHPAALLYRDYGSPEF